MTDAPRETPLHAESVALGARFVPFGGFAMPIQYGGILREHAAVRERAGLFDLSHMAQYELSGPGVAAWADRLTVNDVASMRVGQARYNIFTNDRGGALDDVLFYRLADEKFLLVVNAANASKMLPYLQMRAAGQKGVSIASFHGERALIAVQGPRSVPIVSALATGVDVAVMPYYSCAAGEIAGISALVARTGYTGEDGFEIFVDGTRAPEIWRALLGSGTAFGLEPAGLGARDVLRLEAGMPLYGHELTETISPVAAGLRWAVKLSKSDFPGRDALAHEIAADDYDRIAGIVLDGRVPAREGYRVEHAGRLVGTICSGSIAPSVGNSPIATALLRKASATPGTRVDVVIRGVPHAGVVTALPFYSRKPTTP